MANTHSLKLVTASSQAVSVVDAASLKPSGSFTVELWIRPTSVGAFSIFFQSYSENTFQAGINIGLLTSSKIQFVLGRNTGTLADTDFKNLTSNGTCPNGVWTHVVCIYNGTNMYIYLNGELDNSVAWANNPGYAATNYVRIGCRNINGTNDFFYNGELDEVRLWNAARTQAQVRDNLFSQLLGNETNLQAYWKLDNTYTDLTTNANNGTAIGTPTFRTAVPFVAPVASQELADQPGFSSGGDTSLKAYYRLEDLIDSSGNANDLTNNGTTPFNASKFGNGMDQGASNSTKYLTIASAILDPAADFTIGFWMKVITAPSASTYRLINLEKNQATGYVIIQYSESAGTKTLTFNASNGSASFNIDLGTSAYHHIAATCISGALKLYLDGVLVATGTRSNDSTTLNRSAIGAKNDGTSVASCFFDDVAWFNRGLAPWEVASIYNTPSVDQEPKRALKLRSALSQALEVTDASVLKPTGSFTVEGWFKSTVTAGTQVLFQSYNNAGSSIAGIKIHLTSNVINFLSGKNTGTTANTDYKSLAGSAVVNDGAWHHFACVYDGTNMTIYIDGKQDAQSAWANAAAYAAANRVRIGCDNDNGTNANFFDGELAQIRLWAAAKTQAEIRTNMETEVAVGSTNLSAYWKFNGRFGDNTSNGHNSLPKGGAGLTLDTPFWDSTSKNSHALAIASTGSQNVVSSLSPTNPTSDYTIEFWVKLRAEISSGTYQFIQLENNTGKHVVYIQYEYNAGTRRLVFKQDRWVIEGVSATYNVSLGTGWHHIACQKSGSTLQIYVDGVAVGTSANFPNHSLVGDTTTGNKLIIGSGATVNSTTYSNYSDGYIDDVRVWNVVRTATQINDNKSSQLAGNETNLQGYWKLNNNLRDLTTNYNQAVASGNPVMVTDAAFVGISLVAITKIVVYNINNAVSNSKILIYNINALVEKTKILIYNINNAVSKTLTVVYTIGGAVAKTLTIIYNIFSYISQTKVLVYNINQLASKQLILIYNIVNFVAKTLTMLYHITGLVTKTLTTLYNINTLASKTKILVYNIGGLVGKTLTIVYSYAIRVLADKPIISGILKSNIPEGRIERDKPKLQ